MLRPFCRCIRVWITGMDAFLEPPCFRANGVPIATSWQEDLDDSLGSVIRPRFALVTTVLLLLALFQVRIALFDRIVTQPCHPAMGVPIERFLCDDLDGGLRSAIRP